jgi:hypothetical protein
MSRMVLESWASAKGYAFGFTASLIVELTGRSLPGKIARKERLHADCKTPYFMTCSTLLLFAVAVVHDGFLLTKAVSKSPFGGQALTTIMQKVRLQRTMAAPKQAPVAGNVTSSLPTCRHWKPKALSSSPVIPSSAKRWLLGSSRYGSEQKQQQV